MGGGDFRCDASSFASSRSARCGRLGRAASAIAEFGSTKLAASLHRSYSLYHALQLKVVQKTARKDDDEKRHI